jgi:predicted anti-sigma-YlaC factor YlaD
MGLNCKEVTRLLLEAEERRLSETEVRDLDYHLAECLACRNMKGQFSFLRRALDRYAKEGPPSESSP